MIRDGLLGFLLWLDFLHFDCFVGDWSVSIFTSSFGGFSQHLNDVPTYPFDLTPRMLLRYDLALVDIKILNVHTIFGDQHPVLDGSRSQLVKSIISTQRFYSGSILP